MYLKCILLVTLLLGLGVADKAAVVQVDDAAYRTVDKVCDMMMQIVIIGISMLLGFFIGRTSAAEVIARKPVTTTAEVIEHPVLTSTTAAEVITIEAEELTIGTRLRSWNQAVTGTKEDLVKRFESARGQRHLALAARR